MEEQNFKVKSAPNKSKIRGKVIKIENNPKLGATVLQIKVEESYDVDGMLNFTKSRVGSIIKICIPADERNEIKKNQEIEETVSFEGDESGGIFFIVDNYT